MELLFTINETLSDSLHPINTTTFATFATDKVTASIKIKLLMTPNQTYNDSLHTINLATFATFATDKVNVNLNSRH